MEPRKLPDTQRKTGLETRELLLLLAVVVAALIFVFCVLMFALSNQFGGGPD